MSGDRQQCLCGHSRETHEHYRRGSDCSLCGVELCPRFRRRSALSTFLTRRRTPPEGSVLSVAPEPERDEPERDETVVKTWRPAHARDDEAS